MGSGEARNRKPKKQEKTSLTIDTISNFFIGERPPESEDVLTITNKKINPENTFRMEPVLETDV